MRHQLAGLCCPPCTGHTSPFNDLIFQVSSSIANINAHMFENSYLFANYLFLLPQYLDGSLK